MAALFRDLGADQQLGARCEGALAAARVLGAAERLRRCWVLAASFPQRLRVLAAALAAASGRAGAPRDAHTAIIRSTFRVAPEAFSALLTRKWREAAGAWAVFAPWRFARVALGAGWDPRALGSLLARARPAALLTRWPPCGRRSSAPAYRFPACTQRGRRPWGTGW